MKAEQSGIEMGKVKIYLSYILYIQFEPEKFKIKVDIVHQLLMGFAVQLRRFAFIPLSGNQMKLLRSSKCLDIRTNGQYIQKT